METIKFNLNKAMRYALMFFLMATVATTFTACDDDDDPETDLIGTWSTTYPDEDSGYVTSSITFKKDNKAVMTEEFSDFPEDNYSVTVNYSVDGDLSSAANLRLWGHDVEGDYVDMTFMATISGNKLILVGLTEENEGERITFTRN